MLAAPQAIQRLVRFLVWTPLLAPRSDRGNKYGHAGDARRPHAPQSGATYVSVMLHGPLSLLAEVCRWGVAHSCETSVQPRGRARRGARARRGPPRRELRPAPRPRAQTARPGGGLRRLRGRHGGGPARRPDRRLARPGGRGGRRGGRGAGAGQRLLRVRRAAGGGPRGEAPAVARAARTGTSPTAAWRARRRTGSATRPPGVTPRRRNEIVLCNESRQPVPPQLCRPSCSRSECQVYGVVFVSVCHGLWARRRSR